MEQKQNKYKVNTFRLNIRKKPDINSEKVGVLEDGKNFTASEDANGFLKIKSGQYVMAKYCICLDVK